MTPKAAVKQLIARKWTYLKIAVRVDSTPGTIHRVGAGKDCMHTLATKLVSLAQSKAPPP